MTASRSLQEIQSADALRAFLDQMNESGTDFIVSGMDSVGQPFLAFLSGAYATSVGVLVHNPWDPEIDLGNDRVCGECMAQGPIETTELRYPVVVVVGEGR